MRGNHRSTGVKILKTLDPYITPVIIYGLGFLVDVFTYAANKKVEYDYKRRKNV